MDDAWKTDKKALAELDKWCRPLGFRPYVYEDSVYVTWKDPATGRTYNVAHEMKGRLRGGRRGSTRTACRRLVERVFMAGSWLYWGRKKEKKESAYELVTDEMICLKIPPSNSPAEMELLLAAKGWTGNPFGSGRED